MKTVAIQPQAAFANGKRMTVTQFNVVSIADNLFDHVVFKYTLMDASGAWAGESTHELKGLAEYQTWYATPEGAYAIVAAAIGLVLLSTDKEAMFIEVP